MLVPLLVTAYGLIIGSFFNVLIERIPKKKSLLFPSSCCPLCESKIRAFDNIPVISFILLKGKCRTCGQKISPVYPVVELSTTIAALVLWYFYIPLQHDFTPLSMVPLLVRSIFLLTLIPLAVIDFNYYILPDSITLMFLVSAILISFIPGTFTPFDAITGAIAGGGALYATGWIGSLVFKKEAMGWGDIKLMAAVGALFGVECVLTAFLFGAAAGSVFGLSLMAVKKLNSSHKIPFGPFLGIGIWTAVLLGKKIVQAYLSLF